MYEEEKNLIVDLIHWYKNISKIIIFNIAMKVG